jgi:hypothetical protein
MAIDPFTGGYWIVTAAGGVYNYGAPYLGSLGGDVLSTPVVSVTAAT